MVCFTIPAVPPSINDRSRHPWPWWGAKVKEWHAMVWAYGRAGTPWGATPITPAIVTLSFRTIRKTDPDNRAKLVLDGLVKARLIADDGPPHLAELRLRSSVGKPPQTTIQIEAAETPKPPPS